MLSRVTIKEFKKEHLKDLLFLKQQGCVSRMCHDCQWGNEDNCWFQNQEEWKVKKFLDVAAGVKKMAAFYLRKFIFEEPK